MKMAPSKSETGDCQGIESVPTSLVFELFIQNLECPKILRTCRHICHSWNNTATEFLRARPALIDERCPKKVESFRKLRITKRRAPALASPFKNISLVASSFREANFFTLVKDSVADKDVVIRDLALVESHSDVGLKNYEMAHQLLNSKPQSLSNVTIEWENFPRDLSSEQLPAIPNLPSVRLCDIYLKLDNVI